MTVFALTLALLAAVMHAAWNLLVKSSEDQLVAGWTVVAGAAILALPLLVFSGLPDRSVWDLILISTLVQVFYVLTLAAAYRVGDLSFVYPLARGTSPVLVSLAGVAFLGDEISPLGWLGVLTVTAALTLLAWRRPDRSGLGAALATGVLISAYTSVDAAAVREQGSAVSVIAAEFVLLSIALGLVVLSLRGPRAMLGMVRADWRKAAMGGFATGVAYLLVMVAALSAPVGLVSGVRETSVLIAVVASRLVLHEEVTSYQLGMVAAAVAGIGLIAIG
ncbi:MAG TPA: EamA family transporter [Acidimicrobiia bacterium]|nr:EamA family transporter [Acidimicrobiia bacterium]